ncbi:hypothetical protein ACFOHS_21810 [Jhaorihella thermophila]
MVRRYYAAADTGGNWRDWHPEATHSITILYAGQQAGEPYSYAVSDWAKLPDWKDMPEMAEAMNGYAEASRSAPKIDAEITDDGAAATAVTTVEYEWNGHSGQMVQTDRFTLVRLRGRWVIRQLETTMDYR